MPLLLLVVPTLQILGKHQTEEATQLQSLCDQKSHEDISYRLTTRHNPESPGQHCKSHKSNKRFKMGRRRDKAARACG